MPSAVIRRPVGLDPVPALGRSLFRTAAALGNPNSTAILYWAWGDKSVAEGSGFPLYPRGSVTFTVEDGDDTTMDLFVVSDVASQEVAVYESIRRR